MSMIERVARALVRQDRIDTNGPDVDPVWLDENVEAYWRGFIPMARAAIEAMRKPSPKMLRAAGAALSPGKRPTEKRVSERAKHGIRYRAMIDAALEEPK